MVFGYLVAYTIGPLVRRIVGVVVRVVMVAFAITVPARLLTRYRAVSDDGSIVLLNVLTFVVIIGGLYIYQRRRRAHQRFPKT